MVKYIYPFSEMLVRDWDSKDFYIISIDEYNLAEQKAGNNSAFAETRGVIGGLVYGTEMTVTQFLNYRNN